ncbi:MAG: OmpA family protein [Pyrinomonadaceae bacterium]
MSNRARNKSLGKESPHRDRWLISYADLVTLLLALFIVLYAASDHERARRIAESFSGPNAGGTGVLPENDAPKDDRDKFKSRLMENPVLVKKTKMTQTDRGFIVSLSEAGFFAPGEAVIDPEADEVIRALAENIADSEIGIRVEGHTDSTPISNSRYPSNWELSTARASTVLIRLTELGVAPQRLSAAGYGGFQPVAENSTPEGRSQNRRVDVVFLNR